MAGAAARVAPRAASRPRAAAAVAGPIRVPLGSLSPCCFPSAVLFQHLIIYRGLCGRLYRGSYCLIELLDSSAAKIITCVKKRSPLEEQPGAWADLPMAVGGSTHPGTSARLAGEVWGVHHPCPTSPQRERDTPRERVLGARGSCWGAGVAEHGCSCQWWAQAVAEPC